MVRGGLNAKEKCADAEAFELAVQKILQNIISFAGNIASS
jgi:hypothetical protein